MGFASVRKSRITAITGGIWFTLLLATGIQGKLATQTPSKHPGHKPELLLLHAKGWMWAWSFSQPCVSTHCVWPFLQWCVRTSWLLCQSVLKLAVPRALSVYPPNYTLVATTQVDRISPPTHTQMGGRVLHKTFSTSSLSLCQCTQLKQGWNRRQQGSDGSVRPCRVVTSLTSSGLPLLVPPK